MSSPLTKTLKRTAAIAAGALLIQIGGAAAASPPGDFQQQVRRVLAGTSARPGIAHSGSRLADRRGRDTDAQAFVRGLLLGVSPSRPPVAESAKRQQARDSLEIARAARPGDDAQAGVRQLLLGQHSPMHGVL